MPQPCRGARSNERTSWAWTADPTTRAARQVTAGLLHEWDDLAGAQSTLRKLTEPPHRTPTDVFALSAQIQLADVLRSERDVSAALDLLLRMRQLRPPPPGSAIDGLLRRSTVLSLLAIGRIDAARITLGPPPYPNALAIAAALVELADGESEIASDYLDAYVVDTPRRLLGASLLKARVAAARADDRCASSATSAARSGSRGARDSCAPSCSSRPTSSTGCKRCVPGRPSRSTWRTCAGRTAARWASSTPSAPRVIEPQISTRELEVLSYLPTQLSAREIADDPARVAQYRQDPHAERVPQARLRLARNRGGAGPHTPAPAVIPLARRAWSEWVRE